MTHRTSLGSLGALAIGPLTAVTMSVALAAPAHAATGGRAHWALDEVGGPTLVAHDDSGTTPPNDGAASGVTGDGSAYTFSGPGSKVVVPDSPSLSPATSDFQFGVTVTTTLPTAGTDYDLLRKGLSSTKGGEYKIEVLNINGNAKAMCLAKDINKHVASVRSPITVNVPQTIACAKNGTSVTIQVTGRKMFTKTNSAGLTSVANDGKLYLGTKSDLGGDDFYGSMSDAYVR